MSDKPDLGKQTESREAESEINMAAPIEVTGFQYYMKYFSLVTLMVQNVSVIILMRYVRIRPGDMFTSSTAVIMQEVCKFLTCLFIILVQQGSVFKWALHLKENIFSDPWDNVKIAVPSIVYTLQNNLLYVAVSNLDAATFQVTYQLKILSTALFMVGILRKELSRYQWFSLVLLFTGVSIVQLQQGTSSSADAKVPIAQNQMMGLMAVIASCLMSGFAGVYFEKILKGTKQTLWVRNIQLGFIGIIIGYITMLINDGAKVHEKGFFFGYDYVVWAVISLNAFGGLLVAVVVKYADNILKGFATSAAIVLSCVTSMYLFDFQLSWQFTIGASLVISSVYIYGKYPVIPKISSSGVKQVV